jgi:glycosyltransferase involved in cell wall biosynthesis
MENDRPKISCAILTYNRAKMVEKSIQSALRQTFQDFEILLINNGSTDNTAEVLKKYEGHEKIRVFNIEKNIGFPGGMNFAFDHMRGEWFIQLGDDDEIVEDAFESLMRIPIESDPEVGVVTCNVVDTATGQLCGFGLYEDQYLSVEQVVSINDSGDDSNWWGTTRTDLIGNHRFNEKLTHYDGVFWRKVQHEARHYYLHRGLLLWNTNHGETLTRMQQKASLLSKINSYTALVNEDSFWWNLHKQYNRNTYLRRCLKGMFFLKTVRNYEGVNKYRKMLFDAQPPLLHKIASGLISVFHPDMLKPIFFAFKTIKNTYQRAVGKI